jgi:3-dehydroquinate synthase
VRKIDVRLLPDARERSYTVHLDDGAGTETRFAALFGERFPNAVVGLVTDENVDKLHAARYVAALEATGARVHKIVIPPGEEHKTLGTVEKVAGGLAAAQLDREAIIVALGGGVVGDLAGFCAATWLRGVPYVQVPTTLLAQVDSSVGGKTGVDLPAGKNLVGAFHQPAFVYVDMTTLATLPKRDLIAGLAEVIKHGVIAEPVLLSIMEKNRADVRAGNPSVFAEIVARSIAVKAIIVAADERETDPRSKGGGRARLNFGHTVGHAIEAASLETPDPLRHGEAVALGMLAAARLGARLGMGSPTLEERLLRLFAELGLPTDLKPWLRRPVLERVAVDKKRSQGQLRFVVVERVGLSRLLSVEPARLIDILLDVK